MPPGRPDLRRNHGAILAKFTELPSMIVTLATQIIFRGIAEVSMGSGGTVSYTNSADLIPLTTMVGPFPISFFGVVIAAVIFIVVLSKTTFGRKLYAIGSNKTAAYYAGIKVEKVRFIVFSLAGLMSGFCALVLLSVLFSANTTTGQGFEMEVIAHGGIRRHRHDRRKRKPGRRLYRCIHYCLPESCTRPYQYEYTAHPRYHRSDAYYRGTDAGVSARGLKT